MLQTDEHWAEAGAPIGQIPANTEQTDQSELLWQADKQINGFTHIKCKNPLKSFYYI